MLEVEIPETRVDPEENIQSLVAAARAPRNYPGRCTCGAEVEKTLQNLLSHAEMIIVKLQRYNCAIGFLWLRWALAPWQH